MKVVLLLLDFKAHKVCVVVFLLSQFASQTSLYL
jgi:hypothetical protein